MAIDNDNESGTYLFTGPGTASSERAATQVTTDFADLQVVAARRSATLRLALTVNADGDVGYVGTGRVRADCFRGSAKNRVRWSTATGKREGGGIERTRCSRRRNRTRTGDGRARGEGHGYGTHSRVVGARDNEPSTSD